MPVKNWNSKHIYVKDIHHLWWNVLGITCVFFSNFRPFIFVSLCFVDVWRKRKKPSLNSQVKWLSDSTYKKSGLKRLTQSFTLFACFCSQKKIWENRLKFGSCNRFTFEFCIIKVISLMWLVHLFEQLKFLLN